MKTVTMLAAAAMMGASGALATAQPVAVSIAATPAGDAPLGFSFARTGRGPAGRWAVVGDATVPGGKAIEQFDRDETDYRFPLAIVPGDAGPDVEISVQFNAVAGKIDQAGGIAIRLADADNYYVVRANALENNVRFYRVVKGARHQLEGADIKVAPGVWHALTLRAEGDRFTVVFDGAALFTVRDGTFGEAGKVALWTKADSVTRFHDLTIKPLP
jgi:hypothetical protein